MSLKLLRSIYLNDLSIELNEKDVSILREVMKPDQRDLLSVREILQSLILYIMSPYDPSQGCLITTILKSAVDFSVYTHHSNSLL